MKSSNSPRWATLAYFIVIALSSAATARAQVLVRFETSPGAGTAVGDRAREGGAVAAGAGAGWIVARSFTIEGAGTPTGAAAGNMAREGGGHEVRIYRAYDRDSPLLALAVLSARHFPTVDIQEGPEGSAAGVSHRAIRLRDVLVTSYQLVNADSGAMDAGRGNVQEILTMSFARAESMDAPTGGPGSIARNSWTQH